MKAFLDSSTFIYGLEFLDSNSAEILDLLAARRIRAYINEMVIEEVKRYFRARRDRHFAYMVEILLRSNCTVISLDEFSGEIDALRSKIKEKDLHHIAAARAHNLRFLVAYDSDFEPFPEYVTPRQFMVRMGHKPKQMEY
jgi:predicted nucleic acid-binding protein